MNFVEIGEQLESYPKEQLLAMAQGQLQTEFPQFTILAEIQRRTQMEQAYAAQAARQNDPQETVYEQAVNEFANTGLNQGQSPNGEMMPEEGGSPMQEMAMDQSGEAMPPQGMMSGMPLAEEMPSEGMMQRMPMALGGRVGYQQAGKLEFLKSLGINDSHLQSYFLENYNRQFSPELVEQLTPDDLTRIQEEILGGRAQGITEGFAPTITRTGREGVPEEALDVRKMYGDYINPFSSYGLSDEVPEKSLYPRVVSGDRQTLEYQSGRKGIKEYFASAGAPNQEAISNFIAYNPDAYSVYLEGGGGLAGMQAVIDANLLGEVDPVTGYLLKPNTKAFKPETYIKTYSAETLKEMKKDAKEITDEVKDEAEAVETEVTPPLTLSDAAAQIAEIGGGPPDPRREPEKYPQIDVTGGLMDIPTAAKLGEYTESPMVKALLARTMARPEYETATPRERENELSAMGLATLAKAFGGARNLGEAAETIGEGIPSLLATKKEQRKEANAMMALERQMDQEDITLAMAQDEARENAKNRSIQQNVAIQGEIRAAEQYNQSFRQHVNSINLGYEELALKDVQHFEKMLSDERVTNINGGVALMKLDYVAKELELTEAKMSQDDVKLANGTISDIIDQIKTLAESTVNPQEAATEMASLMDQINLLRERYILPYYSGVGTGGREIITIEDI